MQRLNDYMHSTVLMEALDTLNLPLKEQKVYVILSNMKANKKKSIQKN